MRLRKDHSGYKSSGLWLKYQELKERTPRSHKNTRRWCKGKIGVEHVYELIEQHDEKWWHYKFYKCKNCGKHKYN